MKFDFKNKEGQMLSGQLEMPSSQPRATALFAHCFTCSKDIIAPNVISKTLTESGIAVLRFDFTGLGNSQGDFSNTNFSSNVEDLLYACSALTNKLMAPEILIGGRQSILQIPFAHEYALSMFNGFKTNDWDAFDTKLELSDKNLIKYRKILNDSIDPILRKFYTQLRYSPILKNNFSDLQEGFSRQVQLKTRFPHNRCLFLTKPRKGKRSNKHIGEPSFIIGMGKKHGKSWLEIRCRIEEDYLNHLTDAGEKLLRDILNNLEEVTLKLTSLKGSWTFSHGGYSKETQDTINTKDLNSKLLKSVV